MLNQCVWDTLTKYKINVICLCPGGIQIKEPQAAPWQLQGWEPWTKAKKQKITYLQQETYCIRNEE